MRQRFSINTLVPALFGAPIPIEDEADEPAERSDRVPPDWLSELDDYEASEELSVMLYGELGEVLAKRIAGPVEERPAYDYPVRRVARVDGARAARPGARRRGCRKARR